jgi:hypothetical protein
MLIKDLPVTSDVDILDPLASTLSSARASGKNNRIQHPKNQQHRLGLFTRIREIQMD